MPLKTDAHTRSTSIESWTSPTSCEDGAQAAALDAADELSEFRREFHLPPDADGACAIYLAGNSLGLQPRGAQSLVEEELADWRRLAVLGHHVARRPWVDYHENLTKPAADLVGAGPTEVVHMNSTTVNLHLMMVSFYRPTQGRFKVLAERDAFSSDRYAFQSQIRHHGFDPAQALIELGPREGEQLLRTEDIVACIEKEATQLALVLFSGVNYATGQAYDLPAISAAARKYGCAVGFDLAHAVGNVPLHLHDWAPDFAVWCGYKYLNGGPGAVAGCFVHERHHAAALPRFSGWWGHDKRKRFLMPPQFEPSVGAEGWQISNPPILSMTPLLASYSLFERAGMARLRAKSIKLTEFLEALIARRLPEAIEIITPTDPQQRGCQLSLRVRAGRAAGQRIFKKLESRGVIGDWREPDIIRVAPVPLYNCFTELVTFAERLERVVRN